MYKKHLWLERSLITFMYIGIPLMVMAQTNVADIKKNLTCQCDCQMTIEACGGSMNCQFADNLTVEIEQQIQNGMNKNQILTQYVSQFGEYILSAPTKKGFNLVVWILPFVAILAAGFIIVKVVLYWVSLGKRNKAKSITIKPVDTVYEKRLDEVLHKLD